MSDQVKIVAAEDAPSNTDGGEAGTPVQATSETPQATISETAAESASQAAPVTETSETDDHQLVDGPVGDVLDDDMVGEGNESKIVATSSTEVESEPVASGEPVAEATEAEASEAEASVADEQPLVDGPVGEVLDDTVSGTDEDGSTEPIAEPDTAPIAEADSQPKGSAAGSSDDADASAASDTSDAGDASDASDSGDGKGNVRILSVGQQVDGTVKRIADFGAFVDIGVGRDGLIHISELSVRRVGKVTDVITEGQEVTAWIKKLDRDRNRISLTLIDPNTKTIRDLNKDDLVQGTVTRILPYGAFVDIGIGRDALLHVREMGVGYVAKPEDVVKVGDSIEARIIELSRRRGRVDLSLKGLREEPEPTPAPQPDPAYSQPQQSGSRRRQEPEPEPEAQQADDFEDMEVLSPMELAFKRAVEAEGMELNLSRKKQNKRSRRDRTSLQDEIISRTLSSGRNK